jgi:hypothetical protein
VGKQASMSVASPNYLDGGPRVLGYLSEAIQLAAHDLGTADGAVQDAFVEDAPELGGTRSVQYFLSGQAGGDLLV